MAKRRIITKLKIDEISGVDRPCQQGAVVTIMKRREDDAPIIKLKEPPMDFERTVDAIRARDKCSRTAALSKARQESPESFLAYRDGPSKQDKKADYDELIEAATRKGVPAAIASQQVLTEYGASPDLARVEKKTRVVGEFMMQVDSVMAEKRCSRTAAMSEVRKRAPRLFEQLQEV
jgi:hypothetical protein